MFNRKKGFSASQSKRMSKHMSNSTIGTHVVHSGKGAGRHAKQMNASAVDFASSRKSHRAERGVVSHVVPDTETGESSRELRRRVNSLQYAQVVQRRNNMKRLAIAIASVVVVLAVAIGVATAVYLSSSNSKLALQSSNASSALTAATAGEPYYVLCQAELGCVVGEGGASTDAYLLVRVDAANKALTFVSIPGNLSVNLTDGKTHPLYDAFGVGGDAELVNAVANFADVDIAHLVKTDEAGIRGLVGLVGNVGVALSEDVDDPYAGDVYLEAGDAVLDADGAMTLLRASNYSTGLEMQAENRAAFMRALIARFLEASGLDVATELEGVAGYIQTDFSTSDLIDLANAFKPFGDASVSWTYVPGSESDSSGVKLYTASSSSWKEDMEKVEAGVDPQYDESEVTQADPNGVTVEVRNGGGVTGMGAKMGEMLSAAGFTVGDIGNVTDAGTYNETFVIYHDDNFKTAANTVMATIDGGRSFNGGDYYDFSTDLLVIIGKDWDPS